VEVKTILEEEIVQLVWVCSVKDIWNVDLDRRSNWRLSQSIEQMAEGIDYIGRRQMDRWVEL